MKTRNIMFGAAIIIICALLIGVGVKKAKSGNNSGHKDTASVESSTGTGNSSADAASESGTDASSDEDDQTDVEDSSSADAADNSDTDAKNNDASSQNADSSDSDTDKNSSDNLDAEETGEEIKAIDFPYEVEDTGLKITKISGYDGMFLEDGSDLEMENITAIKVKNASGKNVEYGSIILDADGTELEFDFSDLPKDASVIVMEKNATTYDSKWKLQYADSQFAYIDSFSKMEDDVSVSVNDNDSITIKNISGSTIPEIRLFYKYKIDSGEYIGGITYTAKISDLKSGAKTTISPSHFTKKGSKVMMVRTYDETTE